MTGNTRGDQTRKDLMETAARLFSLHGYFHTSTADILEAVSVSKGAFYHHFKSKEELAEKVLGQMELEYEQMVVSPVMNAAPGKRLKMFLDRLVDLNVSGQWFNCLLVGRLTQEMAHQSCGLTRRVAEVGEWLMQACRECITDGQEAGTLRTDVNPARTAELIMAAHLGAVTCRELKNGIIDLPGMMEQMLKLLLVEQASG